MKASGAKNTDNSSNFSDASSADICPKLLKKLRRAVITDEAGAALKEDLRRNPWKVIPCITWTPIPGLMTSVMIATLTGTILHNAARREIRARFFDAARRPIDLRFFANELETDPQTGEVALKPYALTKRRANKISSNAHHLVSLNVDKLPFKWMRNKVKKTAKAVFRFNPPAVFDDCSHAIAGVREAFRSARANAYVGPVFALACLSNLPAEDIASHLVGRDQEMYLQEYSTLAL